MRAIAPMMKAAGTSEAIIKAIAPMMEAASTS
jgi:hypothetical protein